MIMNSAFNGESRVAQSNGAVPQKCPVCADPITESCFCKINRPDGRTIMLCCPSCAIQYIDSARPPANSAEEELRAFEKNDHFFIGEEKPWS
ncbi:MAG: hypothetical protein C5B50_22375 [Verrucomicrobia bacterium]|nr:MAG: hypothetical protein C5B50_22375 [Verrucomicrobiota bacterium]